MIIKSNGELKIIDEMKIELFNYKLFSILA
jgi:hypothetical protein